MKSHEEHTITDPREMRIKLQEMRRGRYFYDDCRISSVDTVVRAVHDMAEMQGLSGEDRYTVMAWHLMYMAARLEELALERAMIEPPRSFVRPECRHPNTQPIDPAQNMGAVLRCVDCGAYKTPTRKWSRP